MPTQVDADENPWLEIRSQASQFAEQAQLSWKHEFIGGREGSHRYNELIRTNALPLNVTEIEDLVNQTPTILFPGQTAFGFPQGEAKGSLVERPAQQALMCNLALARMIKGMPEPEKTSFQSAIGRSKPTIHYTLDCAFASISMSGEASASKWLHDYVFERNKPSPIHRELVTLAVPFLIGTPSLDLLNELENLLVAAEAEPIDSYSSRGVNQSLAVSLKSTITAEKYCRSLPAEQQKEYREFYLRLQQAIAFAPNNDHSACQGAAFFTANTIQHKPSDTKYYKFWSKNQDVTPLEVCCIEALRKKYGSADATD